MDAATIWKFLHIVAMFLAVSIFVGQGMLSGRSLGRETSARCDACWRPRTSSRRSAG